jgi:hypothetical protein
MDKNENSTEQTVAEANERIDAPMEESEPMLATGTHFKPLLLLLVLSSLLLLIMVMFERIIFAVQ